VRSPVLALALLVSCQGTPRGPDDDGGPYLRVVGPVDPDVAATGEHTRAAIAWAWVVDGQIGGAVQRVPFEPRVNAYALDVGSPPEARLQGDAPEGLRDLPALLWGLPILVEATDDGPLLASVDPLGLVAWAAGRGPRDGLITVHPPGAAEVIAYTPGYLLAAMEATSADRLASDPAWPPEGTWCAFDPIVAGLTLYEEDPNPDPCGRWRPLARPGDRTEFQGVSMVPW